LRDEIKWLNNSCAYLSVVKYVSCFWGLARDYTYFICWMFDLSEVMLQDICYAILVSSLLICFPDMEFFGVTRLVSWRMAGQGCVCGISEGYASGSHEFSLSGCCLHQGKLPASLAVSFCLESSLKTGLPIIVHSPIP
jgi:hypothetical protein